MLEFFIIKVFCQVRWLSCQFERIVVLLSFETDYNIADLTQKNEHHLARSVDLSLYRCRLVFKRKYYT